MTTLGKRFGVAAIAVFATALLAFAATIAMPAEAQAKTASYKVLYQFNNGADVSTMNLGKQKVGKYYFTWKDPKLAKTVAESGLAKYSTKKSKGYKKIANNIMSGIVTNGTYAYYIKYSTKGATLYKKTLKSGKTKKVKALGKTGSYRFGVANGKYAYLTRENIDYMSNTGSVSTYRLNCDTGSVKLVAKNCDLIDAQSGYAVGFSKVQLFVDTGPVTLYKFNKSGTLKKVKTLTKAGYRTSVSFVGKYVYYGVYNPAKNTAKLYRATTAGKSVKKIASTKAMGMLAYQNFKSTTCEMWKYTDRVKIYKVTYKTGKTKFSRNL